MTYYLHATHNPGIHNMPSSSRELLEAIQREKYLLIIGPGLLGQVYTEDGRRPPSYLKSQLEAMVEWGIKNGIIDQYDAIGDFRTRFQQGSLSLIGYKIEEYLSEKSQQQQCLREILLYGQAQASRVHQFLARLPFRGYLSTTHDTLLETAYMAVRQRSLPKFYPMSVQTAIESYCNRQPFILKLFGDIDESDSIVLNHHTYPNFLAPGDLQCLQEMFSDSSILLAGFEHASFELQNIWHLIHHAKSIKSWVAASAGRGAFYHIEQSCQDKNVLPILYQSGEMPGKLPYQGDKCVTPVERQLSEKNAQQEIILFSLLRQLYASDSVASGYRRPQPIAMAEISPVLEQITASWDNSEQGFSVMNHPEAVPGTEGLSGPTESKPAKTVEIFISYVKEDRKMLEEFQKHLRTMRRQLERKDYIIKIWHSDQVLPGQDWKKNIEQHLATAHIILLLVSIDFLDSELCYAIQIQPALERHMSGNAWVIPVILRPCDWEEELFGNLQALPTDGIPVVSWPIPDEAYKDTTKGIRRAIASLP